MAEIKLNKKVTSLANAVGTKVTTVAKKTTDVAEKSKEAVFNAMDMNGDGNIDIEDVRAAIKSMKKNRLLSWKKQRDTMFFMRIS